MPKSRSKRELATVLFPHGAPLHPGRAEPLMGDRFHGALLGFIVACHQSGLELPWLERHLLAGEVCAAEGDGAEEKLAVILLWQALPEILREPQPEAFSDPGREVSSSDSSGLSRGTLEAVARVVHGLFKPWSLTSVTASAETQQSKSQVFRAAFRQLVSQSAIGPLQWRLCVDSLISNPGLSPLAEPQNTCLEAAILGLWIGVAEGTNAIPLTEQLKIAPLKDEIWNRAFQIFGQWAGKSQSDRVDVS